MVHEYHIKILAKEVCDVELGSGTNETYQWLN
jgi:hypothetical protein